MSTQYNERPSEFRNIGEDISGAARHRNDTFENPEIAQAKAKVKRNKNFVKELREAYQHKFKEALHLSTEQAIDVLIEYEFKKTVTLCEPLEGFAGSMPEMRKLVQDCTDRAKREIMRKAYNSLISKQRKIRYMRPLEVPKYFEPKTREAFTEFNGAKTLWKTESKSFDVEQLASKTRGVQFGNSVPDLERIYVSENLIQALAIMDKYLNFDFSKLGFAFGARGKAGSIAHYQDGAKVLQFNRHWDGAFVHELGHAIDYALGLPSRNMPHAIRAKYRAKLQTSKVGGLQMHYYMKNTEIFARLFEVFCRATIPELTPFMFAAFDESVLPDLDAETLEWFSGALKAVLK